MFRKSLELIPGMLQAGLSIDGIEGKCRRSTGFGSFHELCCIRFFVSRRFYCYIGSPPLSEGKSKKVRLNCNDDLLPFSLRHIYSKLLEFHNAYAHVIYIPALLYCMCCQTADSTESYFHRDRFSFCRGNCYHW